jgi:hypothetical protein
MSRPRRTDYVCGTYEAYQAHIRRGEPRDAACIDANRTYNQERRHGRRIREAVARAEAAERRAHERLAEEYPDRFLVLLLEENARNDEGNQDE